MRIAVEKERDPDEIYETIGHRFAAQFTTTCTVDHTHKIKRGDYVSRVALADNPLLPVSGVACPFCVKHLPRAVED